MRKDISRFCAKIGSDPLLAQGAGGNVSWKDGHTLWVKASGTWLAEARQKDIFVPVDLPHLQNALLEKNYDVTPLILEQTTLRPSIETLLHGLFPHRVVLHLHAVEALAYLVRESAQAELESRLDDFSDWAIVDYHRPGADLAKAIHDCLQNRSGINLVFLKNHGIVIGGTDMETVSMQLVQLMNRLAQSPFDKKPLSAPPSPARAYIPVADACLHHLACDASLFSRLAQDWALYPDQVVFLGSRAHAYPTWEALKKAAAGSDRPPEPVFLKGKGVYVTPNFTKAQLAQLRCYYDVLIRQLPEMRLSSLSVQQIAGLLNWDAEKYRKEMDQNAK